MPWSAVPVTCPNADTSGEPAPRALWRLAGQVRTDHPGDDIDATGRRLPSPATLPQCPTPVSPGGDRCFDDGVSPLFETADDVIGASRLWHGRPFGVVPAGLTLGIAVVFVAAKGYAWP